MRIVRVAVTRDTCALHRVHARADAIAPEDVPVRIPDEWDSVGPLPAVLARAFAAHGIDTAGHPVPTEVIA